MGTLPENSLAGFKRALEVGVDGIELDIHRTADGEIIVLHDETIDRTTNKHGKVQEMTLQQIRKANLIDWINNAPTKEKIPTLLEVFHLVDDYPEVMLNIELKMHRVFYPGLEKELLALIEKQGVKNEIIFSSFHLPALLRIKKLDPAAKIAYLVKKKVPMLFDYVTEFNLEGIHPSKKLYIGKPEQFENCGNIRLWTVNQEKEIREAFELGVDSIITDYPELALAIRDQSAKRKFRFFKR